MNISPQMVWIAQNKCARATRRVEPGVVYECLLENMEQVSPTELHYLLHCREHLKELVLESSFMRGFVEVLEEIEQAHQNFMQEIYTQGG